MPFEPVQSNGGSTTIKKEGTAVGTQPGLNLIPGANVTITVTEDSPNNEVDVTIAASVTGASGVDISDEGGSASTVTSIDFVGSMVSASVVGPDGTVTLAHGTQAGGTTHPDADGSTAGFMSAANFTKLAGIAASATNGITTQDEGAGGGVNQTTLNFVGSGVSAASVGSTTTVTIVGGGGSGDVVGPGSATDNAVARYDTTTGKLLQNSAVTIDDSGNIATAGTVDGRDVSVDGTKLDGVEAGADVTDATNVAAAGALMSGASAGGDLTGTYPNPTIGSTTGSGAFVRATSPTLVTPVLGAASATSLTLTTDLAVADGGTGASNASGARTNLGLVIGTDVAAASHTHAAADIVSGVIDPARLGSGGGGATKFLREDSTFQTISGGGDALTSSPLSQFAATTSSQLAGVISDETGTGALVFATSPTLVTPVLGAASATSLALSTDLAVADGGTGASNASGARTNLGLVIGTDVAAASHVHAGADITSGTVDPARLGSGASISTKFLRGDSTWQTISGGGDALTSGTLAQFAATTSAQLAGVISDETGNGALVFAISPTLVTPVLGAASATSLTLTTDLAVADGGTGASTASAARTNLGLVIGTDVQAQDAELAAIAGLTSAADRLPYFTGSGTAALATFSAAARTVVDDASVSDMVNTLGGATSTGSGGLVRATSPTLTTPVLGAASATSLTLTTDLAVADGGTGASTAAAARTNLGIPGIPVCATFGDGNDTATVVVGQVAYVRMPFAGTITRWDIVADVAITGTIDIWKDTTLPTNADSIAASAKPALTTSTNGGSTTLTGWTTTVSVGDIIGFELEALSSGTPKQITVSLMVA